MKTFLLLFIGAVSSVFAAIVVPGANGNAESAAPFSSSNFRYQQVYDASAFGSLAPVGGMITSLWFKVSSGGIPTSFASLQINFSATSRSVDGLSTVFADNVGANDQIAFSGPLAMQFDPGTLGIGGFRILLTTPFYYNPAAGNLLMDVRMNTGFASNPGTLMYSAFSDAGDPTSSIHGFPQNALTGTRVTTGLATAFGVRPVPEPSSIALAIVALVLASFFGFRKNQPNRKE